MSEIKFKIDGKDCVAQAGQCILDAAADNGVFIPALCHMKGVIPAGSCRICTVRVNGRPMAACTTPVSENMEVANNTPELSEIRKMIVETLFVEGNHFCPACEKSGDCQLQALGYRFQMMAPRFPYTFPMREVDANSKNIFLDRNRCIMCKKCIRIVKTEDGKSVFAFRNRGAKLEINIDVALADTLSEEMCQKAMDICPVGAILRKERGFSTPIGKHKYDTKPIGSEIEMTNK